MGDRNRHEKFEALYAANAQDLISYVLRRVQNSHEAAEIVAEAMVAVWRRLDDVPEGGDARLWLFGVVRNVMNNSRRSSRRQKRLIEKISALIEPAADGEIVLRDSRTSEVQEAMNQLRPIEAEVIRLNMWEELTPAQIAVHLQLLPETVRTHLHRGKLKLRDLLGHIDVPDMEKNGETGE